MSEQQTPRNPYDELGPMTIETLAPDEWTDGSLSDLTDAIRMPSSMQRITPDPFSDSTPLVCSTDPGEPCEACQ